MSSYARYCHSQAAECARRAKLAISPDVKAYHQRLGLQWLKLTEKARAAGERNETKNPAAVVSIPCLHAPARPLSRPPHAVQRAMI
jgi:hypothetical protein